MNSCACEGCQKMCKTPCFPTPNEAQKLIDAGYSKRLQFLRWWHGWTESFIAVLRPAYKTCEGTLSAEYEHFEIQTSCTFQNNVGLCTLHDLGLKPSEGRETPCSNGKGNKDGSILRQKYIDMWDTKEARATAFKWADAEKVKIL